MDKKYLLFPQKLIIHDCQDFGKYRGKLIDYCYSVKSEEPNTFDYTMRHGWQSSTREFSMSRFDPYRDFFMKNIEQCLVSYGIDLSRTNFILNAVVLNINQPGSYQISHIHPGAHLSGVMWIQAPERCGKIAFQNENCFSMSAVMETMLTDVRSVEKIQPYFYIEPKEGKMIMFPPTLRHHVETNMSNEDRIGIGYNIILNY